MLQTDLIGKQMYTANQGSVTVCAVYIDRGLRALVRDINGFCVEVMATQLIYPDSKASCGKAKNPNTRGGRLM